MQRAREPVIQLDDGSALLHRNIIEANKPNNIKFYEYF